MICNIVTVYYAHYQLGYSHIHRSHYYIQALGASDSIGFHDVGHLIETNCVALLVNLSSLSNLFWCTVIKNCLFVLYPVMTYRYRISDMSGIAS